MGSEKPINDEESGVGNRSKISGADAGVRYYSTVGKGRKTFEMGTSSNSRAFEVESWAFVPQQNYSLQLMQKVEPKLDGDEIPATFHETLSYFRVYTSTIEKSQQLGMYFLDFNSFIWQCVLCCIFKSLPINYIHLFLSSYVPQDHMYIPKMVPLMYGYNILTVVSILSNFVYALEPLLMLLYYAFLGVIRTAPWNRCEQRIFLHDDLRITCMNLEEFRTVISNIKGEVPLLHVYVFQNLNGSRIMFLPAPLKFFWDTRVIFYEANLLKEYKACLFLLCFIALIGLCYGQIYKKTVWQALNYSHWILNLFYVGTMFHIFIFWLETKMVTKKSLYMELYTMTIELHKALDFDIFSVILGVPPVLNFIASRTNREINPAGDSATITFSNFVNYLVRAITTYIMRKYCEHQYKVSLLHAIGKNSIFYMWPYYFSLIPFGDLLACIFFSLHGLSELLAFVITSNIACECIQSEFPKLKWWLILIIILPCTILYRFCILIGDPYTYNRDVIAYVFLNSSAALIETLIIIYLYPIARLEDDITFHTGSPPLKVISLAIRILPIYFGVKLYLMISALYYNEFAELSLGDRHPNVIFIKQCIYSVISIIVFGILYAVIKNLWINKQNWRALLRPIPQWGPKDHTLRQLRKYYDSREYIASTASRYLSQFMKSKLNARMYRIDVCYEMDRSQRRSTVAPPPPDSFRYYDETKKDV